jgi:hypothetical protein
MGHAQTPSDTTSTAPADTTAWDNILDGVTVTAQRQLIKQEVDRTTYDVQADNDSKTQTAMDMLRTVPMVTVDGEENILVRGNTNFKIYKNGHLDPSLTKNAKDVLKAIPASSIKRIEVITDPGAREDAEGVNAILNIVMMDNNRMEGISGSLYGSYDNLKMPSLSAYLAAQMGKAIVSVNYGCHYMSKKITTNNGYIERTFLDSGNSEVVHNHGVNPGPMHYADINASFDIDTLNLLSASLSGYYYKINVQSSADVTKLDPMGNHIYSYTESSYMPSYSHHSWNTRLDYEHRTHRKDEKITFSYMLALTRQHSDQETTYSNLVDFPYPYDGFLQKSRERFTEHTLQLDYVRPLWEGHKLEVGAKYIDRLNSSLSEQLFYESSLAPTCDDFNHTMRIAALYADYMWTRGNWSARAGLRYEYSYMKGHYPNGKSPDFDKHLSDWVPQASIKYQINDQQSIRLVYTTSINRPGITYLNPAVRIYPGGEQFGNAQLGSVRTHSIGLPYMYTSSKLTIQLWPQYRFVSNALGSIIYARGDTRVQTYGNVIRQHRWQLESYIQWKPLENTTFVANLNLWHRNYKSDEIGLELRQTSMYYYLYVAQKLPWKLQVTAYTFGNIGRSSDNIYSVVEPWNRYAFTLQRSFLSDDRLTVRLTANSPFHKNQHYKTRTTQGDIVGWGDSCLPSNGRFFRITVTYRFGSLKNKVKTTDITIENNDLEGGINRGK